MTVPMVPFCARFRELAFREMRVVGVARFRTLPPGEYGLLEFYCDEPGCDCRRVILQVLRTDTGERVWATINYGWETLSYYRRWTVRRDAAVREIEHRRRSGRLDSMSFSCASGHDRRMAGASLDPLNEQSEHSEALLELFQQVVLPDVSYVERLKRHYEQFKRHLWPGSRPMLDFMRN